MWLVIPMLVDYEVTKPERILFPAYPRPHLALLSLLRKLLVLMCWGCCATVSREEAWRRGYPPDINCLCLLLLLVVVILAAAAATSCAVN